MSCWVGVEVILKQSLAPPPQHTSIHKHWDPLFYVAFLGKGGGSQMVYRNPPAPTTMCASITQRSEDTMRDKYIC